MKHFKHDDKVKCLFGRVHDRLQGEFNWNTEEHQEVSIRITKDYANPDQLVIGLEDFNFNYPDDVYQETDNHVIFQLFDFAFLLLKEGKEFEVEKPQISELNFKHPLLFDEAQGADFENEAKTQEDEAIQDAILKTTSLGTDTHLMDLVKILKSLSVKKIIFKDGNELEIN